MSSAASRAASIIEELDIRSIADLQLLDQIAFARSAIVRQGGLDTAEARLVVGRPYSVITVSSTLGDSRRQRFSIAHELGHLELHRYEVVFPCDAASMTYWASKGSNENLEQAANEFAAALLLPEKLFAPLCQDTDPSLDTISQLSNRFNVSLIATARQYVRYCYEPVAVVWVQGGYIRWFQCNEAFSDNGFFINVNSIVDSSTVASRFFDRRPLPRAPQLVRASSWMRPGKFANIHLQEQCVAMPNYEAVLSLLWANEEWDEDDENED